MSADAPWLDEPTELEFDAEGLPCMALRHDVHSIWCGYASVGPDHPWFGLPRNAIVKLPTSWFERRTFDQGVGPMDLFIQAMSGRQIDDGCEISLALHVHGGITYAEDHAPLHEPDGRWWFGFDCGHAGDINPTLLDINARDVFKSLGVELPAEVIEIMEHDATRNVWRDQGYVVAEAQSLAKQLVDVNKLIKGTTHAEDVHDKRTGPQHGSKGQPDAKGNDGSDDAAQ